MANIRPYISLDIETTGLGPRAELLQIAAVEDDGITPIEKLDTINFIILKKSYNYGEPYALGMNAWIFEEIKKHLERKETEIPVVPFNVAMQKFSELIVSCSKLAVMYDVEEGINPDPDVRCNRKIQLAGKNVGSFDRLKIDFECEQNEFTLPNMLQHRTIDVGGLYYQDFGFNPSLDEINKLNGRDAVSHDALDDAFDVVHAIRQKLPIGKK